MKINLSYHKKFLKKMGSCADKIFYVIGILIFIINLYFLYNYCYLAVNSTKIALSLKNQVATDTVDLEEWEKTNKNIEWKKTPLQEITSGMQINDPFRNQKDI